MQFDLVVIGGGMGGYTAALRAAEMGARVALVEEAVLGGTCLNRGCVPAKAWLSTVAPLRSIQEAPDLGVRVERYHLDPPLAAARVRGVVEQLRKAVARTLESAGVQVFRGRARLLDGSGPSRGLPTGHGASAGEGRGEDRFLHQVVIEGQGHALSARAVVLATGSAPAFPSVPGLGDAEDPLPGVASADYALDTVDVTVGALPVCAAADPGRVGDARFPRLAGARVPARLVVVGGGVIGVEMACLYAGMGARVTVLEMMGRLVPVLEEEIGEVLAGILARDGVEVITGARLRRVAAAGRGDYRVEVSTPDGERVLEADGVLVATGRKPRLDAVREVRGLRLANGWVWVDDHLRTSVPGVFAVGDVTGRMLLAHVAARQGVVAVENALGTGARMDYRAVPACLYTRPEVAWVGLSAREARERGYDVLVGRASLAGNARALAGGEGDGWVEVVAERRYGEILGMRVVGPHAGELIAQAAGMMQVECTVGEWATVVHPHPTLSEAVAEAVALATRSGAPRSGATPSGATRSGVTRGGLLSGETE